MRFIESVFYYPWVLILLGLLPAVALAWYIVQSRRQRALLLLVGVPSGFLGGARRRWPAAGARLGLFALLIAGSAGPLWGRDPEAPPSEGRDILVVLDVSRSMLAEDPPRSRLDRAKDYLRELADSLQRHGGYRLGLLVFAGQGRMLCPLTGDYDHFRFAVEEAHPHRLGPGGRLGKSEHGTHIRPAVELAVANLDPRLQGFQEILLISDGDDLAGDWRQGIEVAQAAGVSVHTLAVGKPDEAFPIPEGTGYMMFQGQRVETRRQDHILQEIAQKTRGVSQPEETAQPLVQWFQSAIRPLPVREWSEDHRPLYKHRYPYFFAAALVFLVAEMLGRLWPWRGRRWSPEISYETP